MSPEIAHRKVSADNPVVELLVHTCILAFDKLCLSSHQGILTRYTCLHAPKGFQPWADLKPP